MRCGGGSGIGRPPARARASQLLCLDLRDGSEVWSAPATEGRHTPLVTDDTVYALIGEKLTALDVATGAKRWDVEVGAPAALGGTFHLRDGVIYGCFRRDERTRLVAVR